MQNLATKKGKIEAPKIRLEQDVHFSALHSYLSTWPLGIIRNDTGHHRYVRKRMIEKTVKKFDLKKDLSIKEDLAYWLTKTPQERIATIEFLRVQYHGGSARLQRSARVVQQTQS